MSVQGERLFINPYVERLKREAGRIALSLFQEYVLLGTPRDHPPGFEKNVRDLMRGGKRWPIIIGSHKAHPAGFSLIEEADYIAQICNPILSENDRIKGSLVLIANTMKEGQSGAVVEGLERAKRIFEKYHTEIAFVLREKDAQHLSPEVRKEMKQEYLMRLLGQLGMVVERGQIPLDLAEGTVDSGRQKPGGAPGEIKGMVYLQPNSVALPARMILRQGKEPLFFFVGTTGENRVYDPITENITKEAQVTAVKRAMPFGRYFVPPIMSSVVGCPVTYSQLVEAYGSNGKLEPGVLEQVSGELLAQLLPPNERGVYAEPTLLDRAPEIPRRDTSALFG